MRVLTPSTGRLRQPLRSRLNSLQRLAVSCHVVVLPDLSKAYSLQEDALFETWRSAPLEVLPCMKRTYPMPNSSILVMPATCAPAESNDSTQVALYGGR